MRIAARLYRLWRPSRPMPRVAFFHLPKCGGTSLEAALLRAYRDGGQSTLHMHAKHSVRAAQAAGMPMADFRKALLLYHLQDPSARYISGHYIFSEAALAAASPRWQLLTVLREPMARFYSQYFFNRYKRDHEHFGRTDTLEAYLDTRGAAYAAQLYSRQFGFGEGLDRALDTLSRFAFAGVLEDSPGLVQGVSSLLGTPPRIEQLNASPRSNADRQAEITPEIDARVREMCAEDLALYSAVRSGSFAPSVRSVTHGT